ncbi:MAG TPA: hypothetical protein VEJ40_00570 [Pseudolabrys sp.]|nr:hypothetical protein [Pseudolabrys sp.]
MSSILRWLVPALLLVGCAENSNHLQTVYLDRFASSNPTLAEFKVCHGFGCAEVSYASLDAAQWKRVAAVFKPKAKDAQAERVQIARGVALIQEMISRQAGIAQHQWTHKDMLVLPNWSDTTQLDCVDEAVNTWTFTTLMERGGLFKFHRVAQLANAGGLTDPFMRNTAVLQEINGNYYAIDASLVDNGVPPPIMPLTTWLGSWPPDRSVLNTSAKAPG